MHLCYTYTTGLSALPDIYAQARGHVCINQQSMSTCINVVSRSQTAFFLLCVGREKGSGKHSMALLFWQSTDSGDYLEWLLVEQKGLLIGVVFFYWSSPKNLWTWMAGNPMGSIDLHQSAGLCAQPEAAQGNPQNLSTTTTTVPCYVYQTLFPPPTHKRKSGLAMRE